jgi:hypothetical protein
MAIAVRPPPSSVRAAPERDPPLDHFGEPVTATPLSINRITGTKSPGRYEVRLATILPQLG